MTARTSEVKTPNCASVLSLEATRITLIWTGGRIRQGKSWAKVRPADRRRENKKAPFPGLF
jgi:hypothetical protein